MKPEILKKDGKTYAVIPYELYEKLTADAEMLDDIKAYDEAKARKEESFPVEVLDRLMAGESPLKVFREYRGMTQKKLAEAVGVTENYIYMLEKGDKRTGTTALLKSIAGVLGVALDDIA